LTYLIDFLNKIICILHSKSEFSIYRSFKLSLTGKSWHYTCFANRLTDLKAMKYRISGKPKH